MEQLQAVSPYRHVLDYLFDEFIKLDVVLEIEMQRMMQASAGDDAAGTFRGMYLTESEARELLNDDEPYLSLSREQAYLLDRLEERIKERLALTERGLLPALLLQERFSLTIPDIHMLIASLAPHVNRKYARLYGYLQDDMSSQYLTLDLMLRIGCRSLSERRQMLERWTSSEQSPLSRLFARLPASHARKEVSMLTEPLVLHPRVVHYLLRLEWKLSDTAKGLTCYLPDDSLRQQEPLIRRKLQGHMTQYAQDAKRRPIHWNLHGAAGSGKSYHARHIGAELGRPLLEWNLQHAPMDEVECLDELRNVMLEAQLTDALLAFKCAASDKRCGRLLEGLNEWSDHVFWMTDAELKQPAAMAAMLPGVVWLDIPLAVPDMLESGQLWLAMAEGELAPEEDEAALLAAKFRFSPGQVKATVEHARKSGEWLALSDGAELSAGERLHRSAYRLISHQLSDKAVKMESRLDWDDLILPEDALQLLRQASTRLKHRHTVLHQWGFDRLLPYGRGISMLFTGPPGTGKTMSALVMAKAMNAELYRIDLSRIVSKYIGETEKNLGEIFEQARQSGAILFFDEADALFGKRSEVKDAHDKYANMETSYLLQQMEEYDGITILATNFSQNLDDAFTRRIQYIVKFPFPDAIQRERLWRSAIAAGVPLGEIDYAFLAQTFELAGGPIKNIVLTAAFLSAEQREPLSMKQLLESVVQEYKKTGKLLMKDRFGPYAQYWKG